MQKKWTGIIMIIASMLVITACAPGSYTMVNLRRDLYTSQNKPDAFAQYAGKRILLDTIGDESKNTKNFNYFSPDQSVAYNFFYTDNYRPQALRSFYWYTLQKAFQSVGMFIEETCANCDAQMQLTFLAMDDEQWKFKVKLIRPGKTPYEKEYMINLPPAGTLDKTELEKRAYRMIDLLVTTVLNDPGFGLALFS